MSRSPDSVASGPRPSEQAEAEIRDQLERVLSSPIFRSSRRCQSLLRCVTERTLAGELSSLKERTLGTDVFHRSPDYDTNQDPVVRTTAGEIRKKLAQYYQEHEAELRIALPSGSYIPEFHTVDIPSTPNATRIPISLTPAGVAVVATLLLVACIAILLFRSKRTDLERFWAPMIDAPGSVLICMGQPPAFNVRSDALQTQLLEAMAPGKSGIIPVPKSIPTDELIAVQDRYIALGDAMSLVRITAMLQAHGKSYRIRGGAFTSFSDLREQSAVLVGAFDNEWALRAVGQLRYTFFKSYSGATETEMVRDRDHPEKTDWKLVNDWPSWNITNDYAIVSRVIDVTSGRPVIVTAGITQFGTMGAGEFITDPDDIAEATRSLPPGWQKRNVQIVLRIPVVHGVPGHADVLGTHVW